MSKDLENSEEKGKSLREHVQNAISRAGSYTDDDIQHYLQSEPLITVTPDEPEEGVYTIFSLIGDREVIFNAFGLLKLAEWIEVHRERLEREAKAYAERYGLH